jgi:hypothetical protein
MPTPDAQRAQRRWRWTSAEVPADATGLTLRFAVSRNEIVPERITTTPEIRYLTRHVQQRTVTLRWRAEHRPKGRLVVNLPFAGALPSLVTSAWTRDHTPTDEPSPAEVVADRIRWARAIPADDPDRDAHVFFAELDAATIPHLESSDEFPEVNATRLALVARETEHVRDKLLQLAGHRLGRADAPTWHDRIDDIRAVRAIMEPLLERHFGRAVEFDAAGLEQAFFRFAKGKLAEGQPEPHVRAPDSPNFLCFAGFARRAMSMDDAPAYWRPTFVGMARAAAIYLAHASRQPGASYWDEYSAPCPGNTEHDDARLVALGGMHNDDVGDLTLRLGDLIRAYMPRHVARLFPPGTNSAAGPLHGDATDG